MNTTRYEYELIVDGQTVGRFPGDDGEDDAMRVAQDMGLLVPASEDEGGHPYAVLPREHGEIRRVEVV